MSVPFELVSMGCFPVPSQRCLEVRGHKKIVANYIGSREYSSTSLSHDFAIILVI